MGGCWCAPNVTSGQNFFLSPMHFLNRRCDSRRSSAFSTSCLNSSSWHSHDTDTALSLRQSCACMTSGIQLPYLEGHLQGSNIRSSSIEPLGSLLITVQTPNRWSGCAQMTHIAVQYAALDDGHLGAHLYPALAWIYISAKLLGIRLAGSMEVSIRPVVLGSLCTYTCET